MDVALGCLEGLEIGLGGGKLGPKLHPGVDFLDHGVLYSKKFRDCLTFGCLPNRPLYIKG